MSLHLDRPRRVLFVVTEDWYFVSHRLPLARGLQEAGFEVSLASRFSSHRESLQDLGIRCHPIGLRRRTSSPWSEVRAIAELRSLYRDVRPDIIHHVAMKPVVYGGLASIGLSGVCTVYAIAGLGFLYTSSRRRARLGRRVAAPILRLVLRRPHAWAIVQNAEDARTLEGAGIGTPGRSVLIPGSGVDLQLFRAVPEPEGVPIVVLPARLLRDKGVHEFVDAARQLRAQGTAARFALVGALDADNPSAVTRGQVEAWVSEGVVEWWGRRDDMPAVFSGCHVVCLPSYREGMPKALLEAAAAGRPIVTTDVAGCRDCVEPGTSGLLVPPRRSAPLAEALATLLADPARRRAMGRAARERAERDFGIERVVDATLALYRRCSG